MNKIKKRRTLGVGLLSGFALVGAAAAIPFLVNSGGTAPAAAAAAYSGADSPTISSPHLLFQATGVGQAAAGESAGQTAAANAAETGFVPVATTDGTKHKLYVDPYTVNDRKFMPILSNPDGANGTGQANMRSSSQVDAGEYPGYQKATRADGLTTYTPTPYLAETFPDAPRSVSALRVSGTPTDTTFAQIRSLQPQFVEFWGLSQGGVAALKDNLADMTFLKKLSFQGNFVSFTGVSLPASVLELEFINTGSNAGANALQRFDPLCLPAGAAVVSDAGRGSYAETMDLSVGHQDLTNEQLQRAVNAVYAQHIRERLFQGYFAGGYAYKWNLRNTPITSFNGVSVPELTDGTGRFYVASVDVYSGGSDASVSESVSAAGPSNDSRIGRIYDWNADGWSGVSSVYVSAKDGVSVPFATAVQEIEGFLRKYPNLTTVDVSKLTFAETGKTLADLAAQVRADLTDPLSQATTAVSFVAGGKIL